MFNILFGKIASNGWVYETFGISKRFPIKPLRCLLNVPPLKSALSAKCFIFRVVPSLFLSSTVRWGSNTLCQVLACGSALCDLAMCMDAAWRSYFIVLILGYQSFFS
jgi:hypothetical protein